MRRFSSVNAFFYARETTTDFFPQLVVEYGVIDASAPPVVTVEPLPAFVGRSFLVSWSDDIGDAGIAAYDVQVRSAAGEWTNWLEGVTQTSEEFTDGRNAQVYEFWARGIDAVGNVEPYGEPEASTVVDSRPPLALVEPLPALVNSGSFTVNWTGTDGGGSGIQYYDVRYRVDGGVWELWQAKTLATRMLFETQQDHLVEFESRAVGNVGRIEPFTGQAEASVIVDAEAPFAQASTCFPFTFAPGCPVGCVTHQSRAVCANGRC